MRCHYLCTAEQERTGDKDSAQRPCGTLEECWYLFQGETSLKKTHSEKEVSQGETCLRRTHSEKEVFQGETCLRRTHSKKENQKILGGLCKPREGRGDPRPLRRPRYNRKQESDI